MFITNNLASFHFWWKEDLDKHQKFSKYNDHDCLQNFILLFVLINSHKSSQILARIYFIILKNALDQTWEIFNTKFVP